MNVPEKLTNFPEWHEGDGPVPYVFNDKPGGHRCGWSCKWATRDGVVKPEDWIILENMSREQLLAELGDVVAREPTIEGLGLYHWQEGKSFAIKPVEDFLRIARVSYREYLYAANPPKKVFRNIQRPGWDPAEVGARLSIFKESK